MTVKYVLRWEKQRRDTIYTGKYEPNNLVSKANSEHYQTIYM